MENLQSHFSNFEELINQTIEETWSQSDFSKHLNALAHAANSFSKKIIEINNLSFDTIQNNTKTTLLPHFVNNFLWATHAKSFLILWRNISFEHQKAHLLFLDKKMEETLLNKLKSKSKIVIREAANDLVGFFEKDLAEIQKDKKKEKKKLEIWRSQKNPWPIFKTQIETLTKQSQDLKSNHGKLAAASGEFLAIEQLIINNIENCKSEISHAKSLSKKTIDFIKENFQEKLGKVAPHLEDLENNIPNIPHLSLFKTNLNNVIKEILEKNQTPVSTANGLIQTKEINFQKIARDWLDSEILPLLYEIWELTEIGSNGIKMSLLNIRNRSILLTNDLKNGKQTNVTSNDLTQPLEAFSKKATNWEENLLKFEGIIQERLAEEFKISTVFNLEEEFLPVSLESTLSQFKIDRNEWFDLVKKWFNHKWSFIQQFQNTVKKEESLSISEKVVRYVQSRTCETHNSQYTSIFLTKGFIGESFWVGREEELNHIQNLINQWRSGFRGAVVLSGQRFSGKSLFGDLVANRYFSNNTITLTPLATIDIEGRKFTCEYDLKPALEFILKYTQNKNPLIWVDDLELWHSPNVPLGKNVRELQKFIDNHARKMFFMVSMSNWLNAHLNRIYELQYAFQAEINLDKMDIEEIRKAILIRHGATHKVLIDEDGKEADAQDFQKMIAKIYKTSEGNIGEALNQWSYSTRKDDGEKVIHEYELSYSLPKFTGADTSTLLAAIMMEKRTNEFRLSKLFGPVYREKYHPILQRLISNGLLTRHLDGWLEVSEGTANDIGRALERKNYLKFH